MRSLPRPTSPRNIARYVPLALVASTLAVTASPVPGAPANSSNQVEAAGAPVTGSLFVDWDRDGNLDVGEALPDSDSAYPTNGISVTLHDSAGNTAAGVVSSSAAGVTYVADPAALVGERFRVEFGLDSADVTAGWSGTFSGDDSRASTAFVDAGSTASFGVIPPSDCPAEGTTEHASGYVWTTCFVTGDISDLTGPLDVLVGTAFDQTGGVDQIADKSSSTDENNLGSIYGLGYDEWTGTLFTSAYLKRHSELGGEGLDGLYFTTYPSTDFSSVSLETLGGTSFGTIGARDADTALHNIATYDNEAFAKVTKAGIGDIDVTPDGRTLLVTNLNSRSIVAYDIENVSTGSDPVFIGELAITAAMVNCTDRSGTNNADDFAVFAVTTEDNGTALVGATCTAQTSQDVADLEAVVLSVSLDAAGVPTGANDVHHIALDYTRGCVNGHSCNFPSQPYQDQDGDFQPWVDTFDIAQYPYNDDGGRFKGSRPSPVFSDISIERDGSLTINLLDRAGDQLGSRQYMPDPTETETQLYEQNSGGEILKVCNTSGDPDAPVYVTEGALGTACEGNDSSSGLATNDPGYHGGPGGEIEFYGHEEWDIWHSETATGGNWTHPAFDQVVTSTMDPVTADSGGLVWFDTQDGDELDNLTLYSQGTNNGYAGKANGIGDVEGCFIPVGLGDYVWLDSNGDGIQGPNELGLEGVTIQVTGTDVFGDPVDVTVQTDANGYWELDSSDGLTFDEIYTISVDESTVSNLPTGMFPSDLAPTTQNAGSNNGGDSDLDPATSTITTIALFAGEVNQTYDAGFTVEYDLALNKTLKAHNSDTGTVTFTMSVFNQGPGPVETFDVTDYITADFDAFSSTYNATGAVPVAGGTATNSFTVEWDDTDATAPVAMVRPAVDGQQFFAGERIDIDVTLAYVQPVDVTMPLRNIAEISAFDDDGFDANGDSDTPSETGTTLDDVDSTPDGTDESSQGEVDPDDGGDLDDDSLTGDGTAGNDEDDHDDAELLLYDLELIVTRAAGQPYVIDVTGPTPTVSFDITVTNQTPNTAYFVDVAGYTGVGLADSAGNPAISMSGASTITRVGPDSYEIDEIAGGDSVTFTVIYDVTDPALASYGIGAEISNFDVDANDANPASPEAVDIDSTPDATDGDPIIGDPTNPDNPANSHNTVDYDPDGDLDVNEATPGDEDDHDEEYLAVPYSLGNQVWLDDNNNGVVDSGETLVDGVSVHLFADADGNGIADGAPIATTTTAGGGLYLFTGLEPGTYLVGIPAENWDDGEPLAGTLSSDNVAGAGLNADDDTDNDDNGVDNGSGYVMTSSVVLGNGEATGETPDNDPGTSDGNSNLTIDFGFWRPQFDIALRKTLLDGTNTTTVDVGDRVTYLITVFNQGDVAAINPSIIDYVPAGLQLDDSAWTLNADGNATITLSGVTIAAEEAVEVEIDFIVIGAPGASVRNTAEVSNVTPATIGGQPLMMPNGLLIPDIDSFADGLDDDTIEDDRLDTDAAGGDEDDHDEATLSISPAAPPIVTTTTTVGTTPPVTTDAPTTPATTTPSTSGSGGSLPTTGSNGISMMLLQGFGLLLAGVVIMLSARTKRSDTMS